MDPEKGTVPPDYGEIPGLTPFMVVAFGVDAQQALQGLQPANRVEGGTAP